MGASRLTGALSLGHNHRLGSPWRVLCFWRRSQRWTAMHGEPPSCIQPLPVDEMARVRFSHRSPRRMPECEGQRRVKDSARGSTTTVMSATHVCTVQPLAPGMLLWFRGRCSGQPGWTSSGVNGWLMAPICVCHKEAGRSGMNQTPGPSHRPPQSFPDGRPMRRFSAKHHKPKFPQPRRTSATWLRSVEHCRLSVSFVHLHYCRTKQTEGGSRKVHFCSFVLPRRFSDEGSPSFFCFSSSPSSRQTYLS
jgi:hypothetical protein